MRRALAFTIVTAACLLAPTRDAPAAQPPGDAETKAPTIEAWKTAEDARLAREDKRCKASRVREWLKIHCAFPVAAVAQIAGQNKDVSTFVEVTPNKTSGFASHTDPRGGEVIFPMKKGDARYFEMFEFRENYADFDWFTAIRISEQWSDADAAPIVSVVYARSQ